MTTFSEDTAVRRLRDGVHEGEVRAGWDVVGNANGGYLMAMAARAMADAAERPHPITLSAHFLSPGRIGPVAISTQLIKAGRRFATVSGGMTSADKPLVQLLGSFGDISALEGPVRVEAEPPIVPPADECPRVQASPAGFPPAMMDRIDLRLHPEDARFSEGKPTGKLEFRGWLRLLDGEPLDVFSLLLAVDAFPPTVFNGNMPVAWAPTVELTAHIRAVPVPGWLCCRFSTRFVSGGMLEEDGEVWDCAGRLVAQSRQLALMPQA